MVKQSSFHFTRGKHEFFTFSCCNKKDFQYAGSGKSIPFYDFSFKCMQYETSLLHINAWCLVQEKKRQVSVYNGGCKVSSTMVYYEIIEPKLNSHVQVNIP